MRVQRRHYMIVVFERLTEAQPGQTVYVTVSGSAFYPGEVLGFDHYEYYPGKKSYMILVRRDEDYSFIDYFDEIYEKTL